MGLGTWLREKTPTAIFGEFKLYQDHVTKAGKDGGTFPLAGVSSHVEAGEALHRRITATRMVMTGVFAVAFLKKKGGTVYLTVEGPEFFWTAEVGRKDQDAARKFSAAVNNAVRKLA